MLIGIKLARLGALLSSGRTPENESIDDTFLDNTTYGALFYDKWKRDQANKVCEHIQLTIHGHCLACNNYIKDMEVDSLYQSLPGAQGYLKRKDILKP